jgi:alkylhydroperoxidase family enzyme
MSESFPQPPKPRVLPPKAEGDDPIANSVLAHLPEALAAFEHLYGTLWSRGPVPPALLELVRIRNARITGCGYCKNVRFVVEGERPLEEARLDQVHDGWSESDLSPREKAALGLADALLQTPVELDDEARAAALDAFDDAEIVELVAGVAIFMGFSKIAVALGQAPESMPVMVLPTPVPESDPLPESTPDVEAKG